MGESLVSLKAEGKRKFRVPKDLLSHVLIVVLRDGMAGWWQ